MLRYFVFVALRSLLIFVALFGIYRLVTTTLRSFFEGLRGSGDVRKPPGAAPRKPYGDVRDADFKDVDGA